MKEFFGLTKDLGRRLHWAALFVVFGISILQLFQVTDGYSLTWLKRIWRNQAQTAYQRSANFYLGDSGSKFMLFLNQVVPLNKDVVIAERSAQFASQGILQYFLFPRAIIACNCDELGLRCNRCLQEANSYVPVTSQFPPASFSSNEVGKQFIPAPVDSNYYLGVYAPRPAPEAADEVQLLHQQPFNLWRTLATDLAIWAGLGFLGILLVSWIVPKLMWMEALGLAFLVGVGLQTWSMFIASWVGIPLTAVSVILIYLVLGLSSWFLLKITKTDLQFTGHLDIRKIKPKPLELVPWVFIATAWLILAIIAVGRSYSLYDDIVIWNLKGHGIAYAGSIFAERLGGHGLAYPLNIPLTVTIFTLFDGDQLPGSKLLFPIALLALLVGVYGFCRRQGAARSVSSLAVLLMLSTPVIYFYATTGFANVPFACYLVLGVLWSYEGLDNNNCRYLALGGLLLALAGWTRPEGFPYALALIATLLTARFLTRQPWRFSAVWVLPLGIFPGLWLVFARSYVADGQAGGALKGLWQQILSGQVQLAPFTTMVDYFIYQLNRTDDWRYFLPLASFLLLAALIRQVLRPAKLIPTLLLTTLGAFAFIVFIFYIESTNEPNFNQFLTVSLDRALIPGVMLLIISGMMAFRDEPNAAPEHVPAEIPASPAARYPSE